MQTPPKNHQNTISIFQGFSNQHNQTKSNLNQIRHNPNLSTLPKPIKAQFKPFRTLLKPVRTEKRKQSKPPRIQIEFG